jgi:hypothetical protein
VRADSGFFDQALLGFLEEHSLPYIIVARMTRTLRTSAAAIKDWTPVDEHYSTASLHLKLHGWATERGGPCSTSPKAGWCEQAQAPDRQGLGVAETNFAEVAS